MVLDSETYGVLPGVLVLQCECLEQDISKMGMKMTNCAGCKTSDMLTWASYCAMCWNIFFIKRRLIERESQAKEAEANKAEQQPVAPMVE